MTDLWTAFRVWLAGWRVDLDGWYVRARRADDPDLEFHPDLGFTEESCIAVRDIHAARYIDTGLPGEFRSAQ